jgi:hypothetical protein
MNSILDNILECGPGAQFEERLPFYMLPHYDQLALKIYYALIEAHANPDKVMFVNPTLNTIWARRTDALTGKQQKKETDECLDSTYESIQYSIYALYFNFLTELLDSTKIVKIVDGENMKTFYFSEVDNNYNPVFGFITRDNPLKRYVRNPEVDVHGAVTAITSYMSKLDEFFLMQRGMSVCHIEMHSEKPIVCLPFYKSLAYQAHRPGFGTKFPAFPEVSDRIEVSAKVRKDVDLEQKAISIFHTDEAMFATAKNSYQRPQKFHLKCERTSDDDVKFIFSQSPIEPNVTSMQS